MLGHVAPVTRLVTFVELDFADARQMSVSARHEAVLVDGRRVLLLDDRGWGASGPPNIWALTTAEDIADTARMVVGPDEPFGGRSHEDEAVWPGCCGPASRHALDGHAAAVSRTNARQLATTARGTRYQEPQLRPGLQLGDS
jgi:hypothetical protein